MDDLKTTLKQLNNQLKQMEDKDASPYPTEQIWELTYHLLRLTDSYYVDSLIYSIVNAIAYGEEYKSFYALNKS